MITQFKGKYDFLDPAYYCLAEYDGVIYNSAEAAFLASQYDDSLLPVNVSQFIPSYLAGSRTFQAAPEAPRLDTRAVA